MLDICQTTRRITSAGGELTSPNYPSNYPSHVDCMCTLSADDPSARLLLSLYDIVLQTRHGRCRADWLMLREGALQFLIANLNRMILFSFSYKIGLTGFKTSVLGPICFLFYKLVSRPGFVCRTRSYYYSA